MNAELKKRRKAWKQPAPRYTRGVLAKYAARYERFARRGDGCGVEVVVGLGSING